MTEPKDHYEEYMRAGVIPGNLEVRMDRETQRGIALLLIDFEKELIKARQLDPVDYFVDEAVNQAVYGSADKIFSLMGELGYRKLPKDKPPISMGIEGMMNELRKWMPENILQNTFLPHFRAIAQAQREADIKHYEEV